MDLANMTPADIELSPLAIATRIQQTAQNEWTVDGEVYIDNAAAWAAASSAIARAQADYLDAVLESGITPAFGYLAGIETPEDCRTWVKLLRRRAADEALASADLRLGNN